MALRAYTHDKARPSTVIPVFDVTGARIFAKDVNNKYLS